MQLFRLIILTLQYLSHYISLLSLFLLLQFIDNYRKILFTILYVSDQFDFLINKLYLIEKL